MAPKNLNSSIPTIQALLPSQTKSISAPFEQKKISPKQTGKILPSPKTSGTTQANKLANSENRPLNQTFTIAKSKPSPPVHLRRNRANSFDSDFADFGPDMIFGFISRKCNVKNGGSMKIKEERACFALGWSEKGQKGKKSSFSASTGAETSIGTKLPSLEGFMPGRTCCQLQFTRSNFELIKYKRNLKNN